MYYVAIFRFTYANTQVLNRAISEKFNIHLIVTEYGLAISIVQYH